MSNRPDPEEVEEAVRAIIDSRGDLPMEDLSRYAGMLAYELHETTLSPDYQAAIDQGADADAAYYLGMEKADQAWQEAIEEALGVEAHGGHDPDWARMMITGLRAYESDSVISIRDNVDAIANLMDYEEEQRAKPVPETALEEQLLRGNIRAARMEIAERREALRDAAGELFGLDRISIFGRTAKDEAVSLNEMATGLAPDATGEWEPDPAVGIGQADTSDAE